MKKIARKLSNYLKKNKEKISPLLILTHDHPDPDAMATAYALRYYVGKFFGIKSKIVYGGKIGRMENRTMAEELKVPVLPLGKKDFETHPGVALVDTQPLFENNCFPSNRTPSIVIDHHPLEANTKAECLIINPHVGATVSIMASVLFDLRVKLPKNLATAMLYGVLSETKDLGRETAPLDLKMYKELHAQSDMQILSLIQNPVRGKEFFKTIQRAIQNAFVVQRVIGVHLKEVESPDLVSQVADFLLAYEKVRWSICTGRYQGKLHVSLRTHNTKANAGKMLQKIVGEPRRAGGHGMIAGGNLILGEGAPSSAYEEVEKKLVADLIKEMDYKGGNKLVYLFKEKRS